MTDAAFTFLQTERLILRPFEETDLEPFLVYLNDPLVARYQTWETYTEQRAREVIEEQKSLVPGMPGKAYLFAVVLRETAALAGHVVLTVFTTEPRQAEIGFTFAREYHGHGLAMEAAVRVLDYVFRGLSLHRVIAITDCENLKSVALLEKLGMRREGHFIQNIWFKGKWGDEYSYGILREEWLRRRDSRVSS